ncbi:hypothetical protein SKDZ_07G0880 [Saccharomyces kudriavzevii ZP591]|nr:hypothetical protein SKDZ_07G0880 [Saccharomyces kudriavzevii ZP591]
MAANLPGFYYDSERRRYFRISENQVVSSGGSTSQYNKDNIKRQRAREGYNKQLSVIKNKRQQTLEKYKNNLLNPLERAFRPIFYGKYTDGLSLQSAFLSRREDHQSHRPLSAGLLNVPNRMQIGMLANCVLFVTKEGSFQDKIAFATGRGCVAGFSSLSNYSEETFFISFSMAEFNPVLKYKSEPTDAFRTVKLERTIVTKEGSSNYLYHNVNDRSNVHTFVIFMQDLLSLKVLKVRQVKPKKNDCIYDSLVVGCNLIISVNDCCHFYSLTPEILPKPFIFLPKKGSSKSKGGSDITSLSFCIHEGSLPPPSKRLNSGVLYIGFRNGDSVAIKLKHIRKTTLLQYFENNEKKVENRTQFIKTTFKSIVSIKKLNSKGLIILSGMAEGEDTQRIIIVDTFLEETLVRKPTVSFRTKFLNVTKDTELFDVADDGHYFIYGSTSARDGKGDFEVFSTILSRNLDYEKSENGNITMYPIRVMRDYCGSEGSESEFIHLHSASLPRRHATISNSMETATRQISLSSHASSENISLQKISFLIRREDSPYNGANILVTSTLV